MIHAILVVLGCTLFYWLWALAFEFCDWWAEREKPKPVDPLGKRVRVVDLLNDTSLLD